MINESRNAHFERAIVVAHARETTLDKRDL